MPPEEPLNRSLFEDGSKAISNITVETGGGRKYVAGG